MTAKSGIALHGKIERISQPRISSTTINPDGGTLDVAYFRVLHVKVQPTSFALAEEPPQTGSIIEVMISGAGPDFPPDQLCYGIDSDQPPIHIPFAVGDEMLMLLTSHDRFPMANVNRELYVPDNGMLGVWRLDQDGTAHSGVEGFDVPTQTLFTRIKEEQTRGLVAYEDLPHVDAFSTLPTLARTPVPTTQPPEPPGIDAPDSETIPTPEDHKDLLDDD